MEIKLKIIGESASIQHCVNYAQMTASSDASVLIHGESGVGKELIASFLHEQSRYKSGPFVTVNCAAVPRDLFESEFFGHGKGAFTGANKTRIGRFEAADGGTLFLDEVGDIPPEQQSKLLRSLQEFSFERLGENKTRTVNLRVIAATNRPLEHDIETGRFRRDLYYRLSTFVIEVPRLKQRAGDIEHLANYFVTKLAEKYKSSRPDLRPDDIRLLENYDWPGNVRELKNILERAYVLGKKQGRLCISESLPQSGLKTSGHFKEDENEDHFKRPYLTAKEFQLLERNNIIAALEEAKWVVSGKNGAARRMGMPATTLSSRMQSLEILKPDPGSIYMQIGGLNTIAALARAVLGNAQADPQLGRFWRQRSNPGVQREERLLTEFLCQALGGPQKYQGASMVAAHRELNITESDWIVFRHLFKQAIDSLAIPLSIAEQLIVMSEALKSEIVQPI